MARAELDRQPTLTGEGLVLRPLEKCDREALYSVASDRKIWEQHPAHDRWQRPVFDAFFDDALAKGGALAVIDCQSGKVVGSSRFQGYSREEGGSVEIGWTFLSRDYWGGAANRELKTLMLRHALASVAECRFAVGATNWRSRKAMEKIGGRLIEREETRELAGETMPHVFYVIGRAEYAEGPLD